MALTPLDFLIDHERLNNTARQQVSRAEDTSPDQHEFRALVKDLLIQPDSDAMADVLMQDASGAMDSEDAGPDQQALTGAMGLMNLKALSLIKSIDPKQNGSAQLLGTEVRMPITAKRPGATIPAPAPEPLAQVTLASQDSAQLPLMATRSSHFTSNEADRLAKPDPMPMPGDARAERPEQAPLIESASADTPYEVRRPIDRSNRIQNAAATESADSSDSFFGPAEAEAAELKPSPVENLGQSVRMPIRTTYVSSTDFDDLVADKSEVVRRKLRDIGYADVAARGRDITLGTLTARFESGKEGIAAIGYDRMGGTSYGKYQLSSRAGTMSRFIDYLKTEEPAWADRLADAGPANTRSRRGTMPTEWRAIAAESPERFEALQEKFIMKTSYRPALEAIKTSTHLDVADLSHAVQEVLHSTAVQHGANGAARIFSRAVHSAGSPNAEGFEKRLIEAVYDRRKRNFGGSTHQVRVAVKARLSREEHMALALLEEGVKKVA